MNLSLALEGILDIKAHLNQERIQEKIMEEINMSTLDNYSMSILDNYKELFDMDKKIKAYFLDPIGSGFKIQDFILPEYFFKQTGTEEVQEVNKMLSSRDDVSFLKTVLGDEESDKIAKIQDYFKIKELDKIICGKISDLIYD